jgi:restriction system protein
VSDTVSEELFPLPEYLQYIPTVIEVQKDLGGSGKPAEVFDLVLERIEKSSKSLTESAITSPSKFNNEMQKVRQVLVHAGLLESARRGVWNLTKKGLSTKPSDIDLHHLNEIRKKAEKEYREKRKRKLQGEISQSKVRISAPNDLRMKVRDKLQKLSSADFEKICQTLLCKSGFEKVCIIERTGEQGFEGGCIFQKNPLDQVNVLFQFKCIKGLIHAEEVRDFRDAMMRSADKGIIITTGTFSSEALQEARRDGVAPVALVDRNKLIDLIRKLKIQL